MKCRFDPRVIRQSDLVSILIQIESELPASVDDMVFRGRKLTFPIVLDDRWNAEALERYMRSSRDKAVYLPSNIEYLAKNNGLESVSEALRLLVASPWVSASIPLHDTALLTIEQLVFGVGFYLACPFLVPVREAYSRGPPAKFLT